MYYINDVYMLVYYRTAFDSGVLLDAVPDEAHPSYLPLPADEAPPIGSSSAVPTIRGRSHFPETWLWHSRWTEYILRIIQHHIFPIFQALAPLLFLL